MPDGLAAIRQRLEEDPELVDWTRLCTDVERLLAIAEAAQAVCTPAPKSRNVPWDTRTPTLRALAEALAALNQDTPQ